MKRLIVLILLITFACSPLRAQDWTNVTHPFALNTILDVKISDGKMYVLEQQTTPTAIFRLQQFDPATGAWQVKASTTSDSYVKAEMYEYDDTLYVLAGNSDISLQLFSVDLTGGTFVAEGASQGNYGNGGNWVAEFIAPEEIYVLRRESYYTLSLLYFDGAGWTNRNVTTDYGTISNYVNGAQLLLATDQDYVYAGYTESPTKLFRLSRGNITGVIATYDGSANGNVLLNGNAWTPSSTMMLSDQVHAPVFLGLNNTNSLIPAYSTFYGTADNSLSFTGTSATFTGNFHPVNKDRDFLGTTAYFFSHFQAPGSSVYTQPGRELRVYSKDLSSTSSVFAQLGPVVAQVDSIKNQVHVSADPLSAHVMVSYYPNAAAPEIKVLNADPAVIADQPGAALCQGGGLLYPDLQIDDPDGDKIRIISASPLNNTIDMSCLQIVPQGQNGTVSSFKIYGCLFDQNPDALVITYTDGITIYQDTLQMLTAGTTPPAVTFTPSSLTLCRNEELYSLAVTPSVPNGTFYLNGAPFDVQQVNVPALVEAGVSSGTLDYKVYSSGGCEQSGTLDFTLVDAPTLGVAVNPSTCGGSSGSVAAIVTPGTASSYELEWNTGSDNMIMSNLSSGAYYCQVTDANNCKATALATVETSGVTVTATNIQEPSCHGTNDGSITLDVQGIPDFGVVWSNGKSGLTVNNLSAGTYEATVIDHAGGCETVFSYTLNEPAAIEAAFGQFEPDCGLSNGEIYGTYSGGSGSYVYDWNNGLANTADLIGMPFGYYTVQVTDDSGCSAAFSHQLDEWQALAITETIHEPDCNASNGAIFPTFAPQSGGTALGSVMWSDGQHTPQAVNLHQGIYQLVAKTTSGCRSGKTYDLRGAVPMHNEICLVTVDDQTTSNEVVWEKVQTNDIAYYAIYRENATAGNYMRIDTVQVGSNSVFNDVIADAGNRSWRYKISAVNDCGVEGPLSAPHKSMHMTAVTQQSNGTVDILWDDYEGLPGISYTVLRYSDENGWESLSPTIPIGVSVFTDTPPAGLTNLDYVVEMGISGPCNPTIGKAEDYNYIRSNRGKGALAVGTGTGESNNGLMELGLNAMKISVFPNPFNDAISIRVDELQGEVTFELRSIAGQQITSGKLEGANTEVHAGNLGPGIYFLVIRGENGASQVIKLERL